MAKLIDPVEVDENETDSLEEQVQEEANVEEESNLEKTASEGVAEVPKEYEGKTQSEIIKMHQEAVKKLGEQGNEVGQYRKIIDDFILKQSEEKAPEPAEEVDWFSDPDKALESKIASHPVIKEMQQTTIQSKQEQSRQALLNKHPDAGQIIQDSNFIDWVKGSEIRKELLSRADQQYDHNAADELFSTWKQMKQATQSTVESEKSSRKEAIKKASTGGAKGSSESPSKKIYRRADIIELMKTDPARYIAMEPEIRLAYAEKRVR